MTTISSLPEELVEEILSRVQVTSLKLVRSTCKQWNALVKKNQRFTDKHFREAAKSTVLILKDHRFFPLSINLDVAATTIEFKNSLSPEAPHSNSEDDKVFHCDGLLLCITKDKRLVVWNPYLGVTRWIQVPLKTERMRCFLGYQDNKSCRSYKILRCWYLGKYEPYYSATFQIYDFSSDSWRVLDSVFLNWYTQLNTSGICLKGNTYWIASSEDEENSDFLIRIFRRFSLPPTEDLIWSKSFTVDLPNNLGYFPDSVSYIIDEEKKVVLFGNARSFKTYESVVVIIGEDGQYHTQVPYVESKNPGCSFLFNCVPSLSNPARWSEVLNTMKPGFKGDIRSFGEGNQMLRSTYDMLISLNSDTCCWYDRDIKTRRAYASLILRLVEEVKFARRGEPPSYELDEMKRVLEMEVNFWDSVK
ncbi:PREDICTED: putative F-box/kelch-repeat protein At3g22730 [Camelina sativa]|uniref:F-box/kelch-repeat protein At3g22730 n=1 Tax=Camelina sativa TaxID=90675 RepID=A0ABM0Y460_CAMSA|nr:PREDICTED: putative F-box/kelch-repeat protein At3g22730 [Camelina sativa]